MEALSRARRKFAEKKIEGRGTKGKDCGGSKDTTVK